MFLSPFSQLANTSPVPSHVLLLTRKCESCLPFSLASHSDEEGSDEEAALTEQAIEDRTETNFVSQHLTIYLNASDYEKVVHKLLKVPLLEIELVNMIIEYCS